MSKTKRWASAIHALIFCQAAAIIFSLAAPVHAARSDEIQKKLDALNERKTENEAQEAEIRQELEQNYDQIRAIVEQKKQLDERINDTRERMRVLNEQIEEINQSIADKQAELDKSEAERDSYNEKYRLRIRTMEETGTISYWSVLFKASSFSDLLSRIDMINEIVTADQLMLRQMEELAAKIDRQRMELEADKQILQEKRQEMVDLNLELEAQRLESDAFIQEINADINMLSALQMEYESIEAELQEEIKVTQTAYDEAKAAEKAKEEEERRKREAAAAAARQAQVTSSTSTGTISVSGFLFPLPAGIGTYITDAYGNRYHPVDRVYSFHHGVDFAVPRGTSIFASKAGTVYKADYGTTNGNYIKIRHNDGSETFYLHLDTFSVSEGAYVTQGQKIGTVGSTGKSTGPHLHFQIMINGSSVNPMDYVSLQ